MAQLFEDQDADALVFAIYHQMALLVSGVRRSGSSDGSAVRGSGRGRARLRNISADGVARVRRSGSSDGSALRGSGHGRARLRSRSPDARVRRSGSSDGSAVRGSGRGRARLSNISPDGVAHAPDGVARVRRSGSSDGSALRGSGRGRARLRSRSPDARVRRSGSPANNDSPDTSRSRHVSFSVNETMDADSDQSPERSVSDADVVGAVGMLEDVAEFNTVSGASKRGRDLLVESNGYAYTVGKTLVLALCLSAI